MVTKIIFTLIFLTYTNSEYIPPGPAYPCPTDSSTTLLYPCVCERGSDTGLYIKCENTGLAVLSVGLGNMAGLGLPIERLLLKECKISHIFGSLFHRSSIRVIDIVDTPIQAIDEYSFSGVNRTLQELYFTNTRIDDFPKHAFKTLVVTSLAILHRSSIRVIDIVDTPIQAIDEYSFSGVNRTLQELYFTNTRIDDFPKHAFKILGNLSILSIDGHRMTKLDKDIFSGSEVAGRLEKLHLSNGLLSDIPVEAFQVLKKLKVLDLHGNKLATLKRNQFKGLRDTEVLDLSHNSLTKLDGSHIGDLSKLGWCNVSHNQISDIPRGMFARNTLLKVLHLDNNKIKKLDTNSFRGMRLLRRLFLQDNQIADVGRGTFSSVTRIGTIDLARNQIKKVDFQMFQAVKYAEVINLAENRITIIEKQAFTDLYQAVVNISHNALSTIEPEAFQNCNNMTLLDFSHNNLSIVSRMAFDENSYAFKLQVSHNDFTDFSQIPIHNMSGIQVLNASYNRIASIPKQAFPKLYELHTVDLSHNNISDIYNAVFQNLFSLRFLNLSYNSLEQIRPSSFGTIPTVLELDLSHNQLRDVSRGSLAKLASCRLIDISNNVLEKLFQIPISLGELNLYNNSLKEIKSNTWPQMNALLRLNLSSNMLSDTLASDSFSSLLTLQSLDLSSNGLTKPPWEALSSLTSLQYLYLQNNNLTSLSKSAFGNLPTTFKLDLSYNYITSIAKQSFTGLQQLLDLSLKGNGLERIPNEAFKGLVALRKLDLSYNLLEKIDNKTNGLLDDCLSLEVVDLSHNRFGFLTKKMFPSSPWVPYRLREIDLSYNEIPVVTHDLTLGAKKVKKLNLAGNIINDVRNNVLGNLTSLEILDLSNNNLKDLVSRTSETKFALPENITELYLQNTTLLSLPTPQIVSSRHLKVLDVRYNQLTSFEPPLVKKIKNDGLAVYFEGNNLKCDCFIRPLKHYLNHLTPSLLKTDEKYQKLICAEPATLQDENILTVDEERLLCSGNTEVDGRIVEHSNTEGEITFDFTSEPDVAFRDVQYSQPAIYAHWFVTSREDIADFFIYLRDSSNKLLYSTEISYNKRSQNIPIDNDFKTALKNKGENFQICIQAKTSNGTPKKWHPSQCQNVPKDFESWPKKLVVDKRRLTKKKVKYSWFSNSVLGLVSDSILITLCIFLGVCFKITDGL